MRIIALLGKDENKINIVANTLEKLEFRILRTYSFNKGSMEQFANELNSDITDDELNSMIKDGIIVDYYDKDANRCYIEKPSGRIGYLVKCTANSLAKLKEIYGNQVQSIYIGNIEDKGNLETEYEILGSNYDIGLANILKDIKSKE